MMNVKELKCVLLLLLWGCCLLGLMAIAVHQQETSLGEELKPILTEANYLKNKGNKQEVLSFVKEQKKRNKQVQKRLKQYFFKKNRHSKRKKKCRFPPKSFWLWREVSTNSFFTLRHPWYFWGASLLYRPSWLGNSSPMLFGVLWCLRNY